MNSVFITLNVILFKFSGFSKSSFYDIVYLIIIPSSINLQIFVILFELLTENIATR